ncbi:MAG TPA: FtsX-like permease family protein, partial [Bryobacteraceae bacterium]
TLRTEGRTTAGSAGRNRLRRVLVIGEVALSLVLLIGAGLLLKSFLRLRGVSPGFDSRNVLAVRLALPSKRYSNRESVAMLHDKLQSRLMKLPGVESAGAASIAPLSGPVASADFRIPGRPAVSGKDIPTAQYRMIDWGYLTAMRIPILRGRNFSERDNATAPLTAIVSDSVARTHWAGQNPIGAHIKLEDNAGSARDIEVVGVAGDVRLVDLESAPEPCVYVALAQIPNGNARWIANNMFWMVRSSGDVGGLAKVVRREVQAVDPDIAASSTQPLDRYLSTAVASRRFSLTLMTVFAAAALLLAASGLYALISHLVMQRTREIGVRVALGAQAGDIFWGVAGEGLLLTSAGVGIGLIAALGLVKFISTMLFGVSSHDVVTMLEVSALLIATGVAASYFPARRAVSIDPLVAMRE